MKKLGIALLGLSLVGCATLAPQSAKIINSDVLEGKGNLVTMPANLRTIDIRKPDSGYIICSEPMPDIAMSNVLKLALDASQGQQASASSTTGSDSASSSFSNNTGIKGNSEATTTALELAGRSQIVLLAREFLYRNCIARANTWIDNKKFGESQDRIINQIAAMIDADKAKSNAVEAKAKASEAVAKVLDKKSIENVTTIFDEAKSDLWIKEYNECIKASGKDVKKLNECEIKLKSHIN